MIGNGNRRWLPKPTRRFYYAIVILVAVIGLGLSGLAFWLDQNWERDAAERDFHEMVEDRETALEREVIGALQTVQSVQAFYSAGKTVDRIQFRNFASPLLSGQPSLQALEWTPRVPDVERESFEQAARQDGFSQFTFSEQDSQGKEIPATSRDEYYPVYYIEPYQGNEAALGFDLASDPARLAALETARDSGQMAATGRIMLPQETGNQYGFLAYAPVYRQGVRLDSVQARRDSLEGFAVGVFRIENLVERPIASLTPQGVALSLYDIQAPVLDRFLYHHRSRLGGSSTFDETQPEPASAGYQETTTLDVPGRPWQAVFTATPEFLAERSTWEPWGVLVVGLGFTAFVGASLFSSINRGQQTEGLVRARTRELENANELLSHEIHEREQAEEKLQNAQAALEERVKARTAQLSIANYKLMSEVAEREQAEQALRASEAETKRRADQLAELYDAGLAINSTLEPTGQLELLVNSAMRTLNAERAQFNYYDGKSGRVQFLVILGHTPEREEALRKLEFRIGEDKGITGCVARTGQSANIPDVKADPRYVVVDPEIRSGLWVPVLYHGELLGIIALFSLRPNAFSTEDERLLTLYANQAAIALANTRLFDAEKRRVARLTGIHAIGTEITTMSDRRQMLEALVSRTAELANSPTCTVMVIDSRSNEAVVEAQYGLPAGTGLGLRVPLALPIFRQLLESGEPLTIPDVEQVPPEARALLARQDVRAFFAYPMIRQGKTIGFMTLSSLSPRTPSPDEIAIFRLLADRAAAALENVRLLEETQQRLTELEAVNKISTALRAATCLDEMLPLVMKETLQVMKASAASLWLYDPAAGELHQVAAEGLPYLGASLKPGEGIAGQVFKTGELHVSSDFHSDPQTTESVRAQVPAGLGGAAVPIRAANSVIGVLFLSERHPRKMSSTDVRILVTVAEIVGNAIHRTRLHEETERQMHRLAALHDIDRAISSSFDERVMLNTILEHVKTQLSVDAATVLLLNPYTYMLEHAAGFGFRSTAIAQTRLHVGEGVAGRAARERRVLSLSNLPEGREILLHSPLHQNEGFVAFYSVPLLAKGQVRGVLSVFHRGPLDPTSEWLNFLETLAGQAAIALDNVEMFAELQRSNTQLTIAYDTTIEGWSRALDLRDKETEGHSQRVTEMTEQLARALGFADDQVVHLRRGALLHDIGKMGIPDHILLKPGVLTEEEWVVMKKHPTFAYELLSPIAYLRPALDIPYCHHERWDGTGYPRGLKGEQIPLAARIFAVVDVWDALSSERPYRPAWSQAQTCEYIREQAGKHFDPKIAESFLSLYA